MKTISSSVIRLFALGLVVAGMSSCGIFGKKKKCPTCPKWSVEVTADVIR